VRVGPGSGVHEGMFFDSWSGVLRVVVLGVAAYLVLVGMLRWSGKRTLSKMNAFDLVVTVALGSTLATILLTSKVSLVEGVVALAVLVGAQFAVAWLSVRSGRVLGAVKSSPTLLVWRGRTRDEAMREQRVTRSEVLQAVRSQGLGGLDQVEAVVLETDGSFSVVPSGSVGDRSAFDDVPGTVQGPPG
jgi:uncharacterized membrane protein YcaP (DUF421 family)